MSNGNLIREEERQSWGKAGRYTVRAIRLVCPVCGQAPLFPPLRQTRSLYDWFTPFDGCPRCGYPYEREPGYFLLSIWAINYGLSTLVGGLLYVVLSQETHWGTGWLVAGVALPTGLFSLLFARHAKALFIAFDHFFDPAPKR